MIRWLNRAVTTVMVVAVVIAPPAAGVAWLWRHQWRLPGRERLAELVAQPLSAGVLVAACVTTAAMAWLLLMALLLRRGITALGRRRLRARHVALPSPAQLTAGSLAGVAALTAPTVVPAHLHAIPAPAGTPAPRGPAGDLRGHEAVAPAAGIALPGGGWIPLRTAGVITALAALTWLHRRRHYRPDPTHPRSHDNDPDLQQLPDTVQAVTAALADQPNRAPMAPVPPDEFPAGIIQLTGPGAAAAGRGLLTIAALTGPRDESAYRLRMDPDSARSLIPGLDLSVLPGDLFLSEPLLGPSTVATNGRDPSDAPGRALPEDPHLSPDPSPAAGDTVIVLSGHAAADYRWYVEADGTTTGDALAEPRRLCTLGQREAVDLLNLERLSRRHSEQSEAPRGENTSGESKRAAAFNGRLTVLGRCTLTVDGVEVRLQRTAGLQILVYLAVHRDGATATELIRAIWPHLPPARIAGRLHTTLTDVRRQLRPLLDDEPVTRHETRYRLNPGVIGTDFELWRVAVVAMSHAVGVDQRQATERVINLYRGELAEGRDWPWLTSVREQIRRTVIDACATFADRAEPAEALVLLQRALKVDPFNEALHRTAADLLVAIGDLQSAAALIDTLTRRLDLRSES